MAWLGIEGHDDVRDFFARVLATGRLAHAYLFFGPSGIGRRRFALALAQTLQCEQVPPEQMAPCGSCPQCRQVIGGTHPDVVQVAKPEDRLEFPIDLVRDEVIRSLSLKPATGRYKVVIVDDVETLSAAAANCLLKTLEEPPDRSLLILIATSPELLLPTILSRCQQVVFRPLDAATIERILLENELVEDPAEARRCARLAEGTVGGAIQLASPQVQRLRDRLLSAILAKRLDAANLLAVVDDVMQAAGAAAPARREAAAALLRTALALLRSAVHLAAGLDAIDVADPREKQAVEKLAQEMGLDRLLRAVERTVEAQQQNERRAHVVILLEAWACALADIAHPPPLAPGGKAARARTASG